MGQGVGDIVHSRLSLFCIKNHVRCLVCLILWNRKVGRPEHYQLSSVPSSNNYFIMFSETSWCARRYANDCGMIWQILVVVKKWKFWQSEEICELTGSFRLYNRIYISAVCSSGEVNSDPSISHTGARVRGSLNRILLRILNNKVRNMVFETSSHGGVILFLGWLQRIGK